jgi:hypothetical protein
VEAGLPEPGQERIEAVKAKTELSGGRTASGFAAQPARNALLQGLRDGRVPSVGRFAEEHVNVLGHDDISGQGESVAVAHSAENLHEEIPGARGSEQGESTVATAGNEMQVVLTVAATQSFGHGQRTEKPRP